jgi:hypothetical protein
MSARRILRIALSLVILVILWMRVGSEWSSRSSSWVVGAVTLSVILVVVVIAEFTGAMHRKRRPQDEVPKKPLGLD